MPEWLGDDMVVCDGLADCAEVNASKERVETLVEALEDDHSRGVAIISGLRARVKVLRKALLAEADEWELAGKLALEARGHSPIGCNRRAASLRALAGEEERGGK